MHSFLDIPENLRDPKTSRIVILPIPYDETSTWVKGADLGPMALIEASKKLELFDLDTHGQVHNLGIYTDEPVSEKRTPDLMVEASRERTLQWIDKGKFVVSVGGEHSISIGVARAHAERYPGVAVIQFDAHSDTRETLNGSQYNHGCVMARVREIAPTVQIGIRSMDSTEYPHLDPARVFYAKDIVGRKEWIPQMLDLLPEKVYITFDLDCFDPGIMPSTGTPEPGGMAWYEVLDALRAIARHSEIVGFDVVELCPNPRVKAPDFLAAKLIYTLLSYRFCE